MGREDSKGRTSPGQGPAPDWSEDPPQPLSPVRSDGYKAVIVVISTEDLRVEQAIRVPQPVVNELFPWRDHIAGRVITVTRKLLAHPKVETIDVSDDLLDAPIKAKG